MVPTAGVPAASARWALRWLLLASDRPLVEYVFVGLISRTSPLTTSVLLGSGFGGAALAPGASIDDATRAIPAVAATSPGSGRVAEHHLLSSWGVTGGGRTCGLPRVGGVCEGERSTASRSGRARVL